MQNLYQCTIKDAKTNLWNDFLKNAHDKDIFIALKYTKPQHTEPTPDIKLNGHTATTFEGKAQLFRQSLFPPPPVAGLEPPLQTNKQQLQWPTNKPRSDPKCYIFLPLNHSTQPRMYWF
jgi:hypothetical protein